jgi:hypothetical protein
MSRSPAPSRTNPQPPQVGQLIDGSRFQPSPGGGAVRAPTKNVPLCLARDAHLRAMRTARKKLPGLPAEFRFHDLRHHLAAPT